MKVLVVGGGGREHAIVKSIMKNEQIKKIFAAPGNGGLMKEIQCINFKPTDVNAITDFVIECDIDYIIVAPDDPLAIGMVDALEKKGRKCFGPNQAAARIESSKIFSKSLMKKYGIPTANYQTFSNSQEAVNYVSLSSIKFPLVIKTDGLALGKGVIIAGNRDEALAAINSIMTEKKFGECGASIVIEDFLTGPEVTVLAFTDGKTIKPMISSMDHKKALDGNKGLNTGGMGAIAPNPHYTKEIASICEETIFKKTIAAMQSEGCPFKGCLYFGLMLTPDGPKVIEYNCRFGDPEAQVVLSLLETDLFEIMLAVTEGRLDSIDIKWSDRHAACVVLASGGYPESYKTGLQINGLNPDGGPAAPGSDTVIYHAGTELTLSGAYRTAGGRVLGICATDITLSKALEKAYGTAAAINFDGLHYRKDIGLY